MFLRKILIFTTKTYDITYLPIARFVPFSSFALYHEIHQFLVPHRARLGQRMLSTPGTGIVAPGQRYIAPKKVLIILVPKAGGAYRLLGPTSSAQQAPGGDR